MNDGKFQDSWGTLETSSASLASHKEFPAVVVNLIIFKKSTLVGKSTTFNVVYLGQNVANYKDLLLNKTVQQISWLAICM